VLGIFSRRFLVAAALIAVCGMLASPSAASAARSASGAPNHSLIIRPFSVVEHLTSSTHDGITHVRVTVVSTFRLPNAPNSRDAELLDSSSTCADDSAYTYQSCLTQSYNVCHVGTLNYVDILSYVERWTLIDPSGDYQLGPPAGVRAGADGNTDTGACGGKGGTYLAVSTEKVIKSPAPSTNYKVVPSWTGAYINSSSGRGFYQCGNAYVQIYWVIHPSRTWTFLQPDVCQGATGLPGT
jgi:hypothetical protein